MRRATRRGPIRSTRLGSRSNPWRLSIDAVPTEDCDIRSAVPVRSALGIRVLTGPQTELLAKNRPCSRQACVSCVTPCPQMGGGGLLLLHQPELQQQRAL